ncbi:hypothetical protein D3C72_2092170 [compost metagenome]
MPQALAVAGVIPAALLRRETMLPREKNSVPRAERPTPFQVSISKWSTISCPNIRTRPDAPRAAATIVRPVTVSPKNRRAFMAL